MHKSIFRLLAVCFLLSVSISLYSQVRLPRLVSDSMVLQRDTKLKIWGWASKDEKVSVKFLGKSYSARAGDDGKWAVSLSPAKAGGPYSMSISGSNKIILNNILVGDVWLCAGQSNMVHNLELHKERYAADIAKVNHPEIRQFLVPTATNLQEPNQDVSDGSWKAANHKNIGRFSVVAYFFAKQIYEKYRVPIGLINTSVGGTPIEAWTSEDGLKEFPEIMNTIKVNKDSAYVNGINRLARQQIHTEMNSRPEDKGLAGPLPWYHNEYVPEQWKTINIPGYWEDQGVRDLDGIVWYRKEIEVPTSMAGMPARVYLGRIVDADFLYVNGVLVGSTGYQYPQRRYNIPQGLLRPGKNVFVVRVINNSGKGGFVADKPYHLVAGTDTVDLKGYWKYKVSVVFDPGRIQPKSIPSQNQPGALYNGMIAPLIHYRIKGMIWYQGESNSERPQEYKQLLPALIRDWRKQWGQGDLPFLFAQLPNFMEVNYSPAESNWALLREAQLKSLRVPNTRMAVTIDLGEWNDIHPGNKKPIGDRLAIAAENVAYGKNDIVHSGPLYQSASVEGSKIKVSFTSTGSGLTSIDGNDLSHFAIAGEDKKFIWAKAVIQDNQVVVWNEKVPNPRYVRYAWADNPDSANLYNKEGLPASPFRSDE